MIVAACDARSIARVAEREHMTPSALSKRFQKFESEMGVQLIQRVHRGIEATAAGLLLIEKSRELLAIVKELTEELDNHTDKFSGTITLMGSYSMIAGCLLDDIKTFLADDRYKNLRINLLEGNKEDVVRAVRNGSCSLGVLWSSIETTGLHTWPYQTDSMCAVVDAHHPLANETAVSYEVATQHPTIRTKTTRQVELMLERTGGIEKAARTNRIEVPSFECLLRLLTDTPYVGIAPAEIGLRHAQQYNLKVIPLTNDWASREHMIIAQPTHTLNTGIPAFVKHLVDANASRVKRTFKNIHG